MDFQQAIDHFSQLFETAKYNSKISRIIPHYPKKKSIDVDMEDVAKINPDLEEWVLNYPKFGFEAAEKAIEELGVVIPGEEFKPHIRFRGLPEKRNIEIKNISSEYIEKMISVDGIITKATEIMPLITAAAWECVHCGEQQSTAVINNELKMPAICASCQRRDFKFVEEQSKFIDLQRAEMQEPLEMTRGGAPAQNLKLWIEDDLVNQIVPGDRVCITGILKIRAPAKGKSAIYDKDLYVTHIEKLEKEFEEIDISEEDEKEIVKLASDPKVYDKIIESISPSIYGHTDLKEAIMLQLFGGTSGRKMPDGSRIRKDIHILLIGDPGVAKSRLLHNTVQLAPKSIYVSGKSASGAGITASAERDDLNTGGWTLKAGAIVLASGGLLSLDEFDKMENTDKAAIHEALESQTVSVAKAGIVARFKSETAVLAAANPKYGRFDPNMSIAEQFDIPPTLLSRFDLIFPMKDIVDTTRDMEVAEHIIKMFSSSIDENNQTMRPTVDSELLRKYIAYMKKNVRPKLSEEAGKRISNFYVELRKRASSGGPVPMTARQIEGLIRLAEASAKVRGSNDVTSEDADRAIRLVKYVMQEVLTDKDSGEIDVDIISTGQSKTKRDRTITITKILNELDKEYDQVEIEKVFEKAEEYGIDKENVSKILEEFKKSGKFYNPKPGIIKLIKDREW